MSLASFGGAMPADCIANNQRLSELTIGFWQNEYIKRKAFQWKSVGLLRPTMTSS
jgi:hypothetical protein